MADSLALLTGAYAQVQDDGNLVVYDSSGAPLWSSSTTACPGSCTCNGTGGTDGGLLRGVRYRAGGAQTQSIVMRGKSGTIRIVDSYHSLTKLRAYSSIDFDHAGTPPA